MKKALTILVGIALLAGCSNALDDATQSTANPEIQKAVNWYFVFKEISTGKTFNVGADYVSKPGKETYWFWKDRTRYERMCYEVLVWGNSDFKKEIESLQNQEIYFAHSVPQWNQAFYNYIYLPVDLYSYVKTIYPPSPTPIDWRRV